MLTVVTRVTVFDPEDMDEISVEVSNSITGFDLQEIQGREKLEDGSYSLIVKGTLEHLDGFETIEELEEKFF